VVEKFELVLTKTPAKAGETKTLADEREQIVGIQVVVRVPVIAVEPQAILIAFDVEDLEVAVGVRFVRDAFFCHCFPIP